MRRWIITPLTIAVTGLLAACSSSAPTTHTAAGPTPHTQTPVTDAAMKFGALTPGVPAGWTPKTFQGLTYAVPTLGTAGTEHTDPSTDADGYLSTDWTGGPIPESIVTATTPPPGAASSAPTTGASPTSVTGLGGGSLPERVLIRATHSTTWNGNINDGGTHTFSAQVPGAKLVGGSVVEQDTTVFDDQGNQLDDRPIDLIYAYVQADSGTYYQIVVQTSPGGAGQQALQQFLSSLSAA